ncbi:Imm17 family immunity protein [Aquimarina sp. 2201CG14-23]|uniref:Imm17 family immunity protein n=1 Tax=Aquimarina mycalae TaxID=3040073 RepID=UPI002478139A|nr:Imm17 family immunity protein [Aquimarina sp. 2201CG14-23]MDH7447616.1 Imm17 family immunity protein [Aquimarina sp. 2201CG14-23]
MEKIINKFNNFIELYPHYGALIAALGFGVFLLGYLKNWNWVMEPGGGWLNIAFWEEKLGNKTVRLLMGIVCLMGIISCVCLFLYFEFISK